MDKGAGGERISGGSDGAKGKPDTITIGFGLTAGDVVGSYAYSDNSTGVNCLEFKGVNPTDTTTYYSQPGVNKQGGRLDAYPRITNTGNAGFGSGNSSGSGYSQGGDNGIIIIRNKRT